MGCGASTEAAASATPVPTTKTTVSASASRNLPSPTSKTDDSKRESAGVTGEESSSELEKIRVEAPHERVTADLSSVPPPSSSKAVAVEPSAAGPKETSDLSSVADSVQGTVVTSNTTTQLMDVAEATSLGSIVKNATFPETEVPIESPAAPLIVDEEKTESAEKLAPGSDSVSLQADEFLPVEQAVELKVEEPVIETESLNEQSDSSQSRTKQVGVVEDQGDEIARVNVNVDGEVENKERTVAPLTDKEDEGSNSLKGESKEDIVDSTVDSQNTSENLASIDNDQSESTGADDGPNEISAQGTVTPAESDGSTLGAGKKKKKKNNKKKGKKK
jgi:hypothetical protein